MEFETQNRGVEELEVRVGELEAELTALRDDLARKEEVLSKLRHTDQLTGLLNRNRLQSSLKEPGNKALLMVDIDNFGLVNNVYGPQTGDYVLAQTALMMRVNKPNNAELFRFAGDEFVYLIDNPETGQGEALAQQILGFATQSHIYYDEIEIKMGFTVGIAYGKGPELLSRAMTALQEAKSRGCNRYSTYADDLEALKRQESNLYWIPRVRHAIEEEAITPWFQPIIDNKTGKAERFECLARLKDEVGNIVDPYYFLEAAEVSGILTSITKAMIAHSFRYFEGKGIHFSLNITDSDLQEGYLEEFLSYRLEKHHLKPSQVTLEIVESITASQASSQTEQLSRLKKMGFLIAADDFGAEHSNFSRLLSIDLDFIKIDGRFVRNLEHDGRSQMIVRNIVQFSKSIGAKTVAEFVSTPEVYERVKEMGVDYSQGFFLGRPSPSIETVI
ncbi:MAG: EAL domain-containing protein [Campylobacterales bacterium]